MLMLDYVAAVASAIAPVADVAVVGVGIAGGVPAACVGGTGPRVVDV